MRKASLLGFGVVYPETVRTNDAWPSEFGRSTSAGGGDRTFNDIAPPIDLEAARITAKHLAAEAVDPFLGVERRNVSLPGETAWDAEAAAARLAMADAGVGPSDIDVVITYSVVPDRVQPTGPKIAHLLGIEGALAFGIDIACASPIVQLELAQALLASGAAKTVLLTQSHLMTRAFPMLHPAAPGIGDAATAMVLGTRERWPLLGVHCVSHGDVYDAVTWIRSDDPAAETPWWKAGGDYRLGSRNVAQTKALMRDTVAYGARTLRELSAKVGIDPERIGLLASVQPRGFIPHAITEYVGLGWDAAVTTYRERAHLGGCGPLANLEEARRQGRLRPGAMVALYGQGAGFTRGAALFRFD
ncbi:MAG: 3-oxoacyl-[acyl-carrier-protein] synthase III C-terminal domain-containing protein [Polyangiales bacterium]